MDSVALKAELCAYADSIGVDALRIAPPRLGARETQAHLKWLERGYHGDMQYLARHPEARYDAASLLPDCAAVVCSAVSYYVPDERWPAPGQAKVSRYAWGDDYHNVLRGKLASLRDWLDARAPEQRNKLCVDTSPLSEKAFGAAAGLGWPGRHSLLLHPRLGSYFFVGLLLTTLPLPPDDPLGDACGTCTKCIAACPTDALLGPGILDATKCVSYLTTERKAAVEPHEPLNGWLYGCDTCQQACPYNFAPPSTREPRFVPRDGIRELTAADVLKMDEAHFAARFEGTVIKRRRLDRLQAQAAAASAAAPARPASPPR